MAADVELCLSAISDGEIKKLEFNKTTPVSPLQARVATLLACNSRNFENFNRRYVVKI